MFEELKKLLSTPIRLPAWLSPERVKQAQRHLLPDPEKKKPAHRRPEPQLPVPRTPYDKYRLRKLLGQMQLWQVHGRSVLEVGCGVGDLLGEMAKYQPKELYGVDHNRDSVNIARQYAKDAGFKADITSHSARDLPFPDHSFDMVFMMHEFQNLPDDKLVAQMILELCRVSKQWVVLVEDVAGEVMKVDGHRLRPVEFYRDACLKHHPQFHIKGLQYLDVAASRFIFTSTVNNPWHWIRWALSPLLWLLGFPSAWMKMPKSEEKLPESKLALELQKLALPLTSGLDGVFKSDRAIAIMRFEREKLFRR